MTQRTTTEIAAELAQFRAARTALVAGERLEDVWKNGRRMRFSSLTLGEINEAIADLQREYAEVEAAANGRRGRSAIMGYYG